MQHRAPRRHRRPAAPPHVGRVGRSARAVLLGVLVLALAGGSRPPCARAAFEWSHAGARGWLVGVDASRWPAVLAVGGRWSAAAHRARPWGWPDLEALRIDTAFRVHRVAAAMTLTQLRIGDYSEERWTLSGVWRAASGQSLGLGLSGSGLASAGARARGHELSGAWRLARGAWIGSVTALGAWRSGGARAMQVPRRLLAGVGYRDEGLEVELLWTEDTERTQVRLGLELAVVAALRLRGAVAVREPRLRYGLGIEHGNLHVDLAWLLHTELPTTQVVTIGWRVGR